MKIKPATIEDLKYIASLSKKESKSVGFIPKVAYESAITGIKSSVHRWSDTCNDKIYLCKENDDPVGFVMASFGKTVKINQICIQEDARLLERGRALLQKIIEHGKKRGRDRFMCGCADDLESNKFWRAMDWEKIGSRKGIHFSNTWAETSDREINLYLKEFNSLFEMLKGEDHGGDV